MIRLSQPKIEVLKELNEKPGKPKGSRHATFDSLLGVGLIQPTGNPHRECEITDEGKRALKRVVGEAPAIV